MRRKKIMITIDGIEFPSKMKVCSECNGHGTTLVEGMKGHAYTMEEFNESFDEVEAQEYFKRGGRYDQVCKTCLGKNVIAVVNKAFCSKEQLKALSKIEKEKNNFNHICRLECMMGA